MSQNQRQWARKSVAVEFSARDAQGAGQLMFTSADLSPGGTFLKSDVLLEQGERLNVEFRLPGWPRSIQASATVAWVRRFPMGKEPAGMGVQFTELTEADRTALTSFLTHD